jgi:23S rRNA G2445 N2-methylase RlmL
LRILATTVPGIEEFVAEELRELCPGSHVSLLKASGRVIAELPEICLGKIITGAHSIENVYLLLGETSNLRDAGEDLVAHLKGLKGRYRYFSVNAERVTKDIEATSIDIASSIGKIVRERLALEVSLDFPDIAIYIEYDSGKFRYGINLTWAGSLRDRPYRQFVHRSALNPIIAYAMCRIASPQRKMWDPFCGSGTIPLECLTVSPGIEVICSDIDAASIGGALKNSKSVGKTLYLLACDSTLVPLRALYVDAIIANPPFGIRERAVRGLKRTYESLFDLATKSLEDSGRLVILSPHRKLVEHVGSTRDFIRTGMWKINEGGLTSFIFRFEHSR